MKAVLIWIVTILVTVAKGQTFNDNALEGHNEKRALHEDTAALTWNDDVAAFAQSWCDELASDDKFEHSSGSGYGENLYWSSQIKDDGAVFGTAAVASWYKESDNWDYTTSTSKGGTTGHFTQVVWKGSTALGCAFSTNPAGAKFKGTFVCCNYKPPGNYRGEYANNVGQLKGTETCEWQWGDWSDCAAAGTGDECYKTKKQECSCSDESKCTASDREAAVTEVCECEEQCDWQWAAWSSCTNVSTSDQCYQYREQDCSCTDATKCTDSKQSKQKQVCECEEQCEWQWGDWGSCAAGTDGKCYQSKEQMCSCTDASKCGGKKEIEMKQECDCEDEKCEWEWTKWSKCTTKDPAADVQICTKSREQKCSCTSTCVEAEKDPNETEECTCGEDDYDVRLVGSTMDNCGLLAIEKDAKNHTVCDDWWGDKESNVACQQLGYTFGSRVKVEMFEWPVDLKSFALTEMDCPAEAGSLNDCKSKDYLTKGTSPCQRSETVALKCCKDKYKFEFEKVEKKCNRKNTKCGFAAKIVLQKQCVDLDVKVGVVVWHKQADGNMIQVKAIKFDKRKGVFKGKAKIPIKIDTDCFIYKAVVEGFGEVTKSTGECE